MGSIFKKFGQGLLYILVLPVFLIAITIFGIYGIGLFIVLMIKSIICFFKGKSLYEDLPEDIEAQRILHPEKANPKVEARIEEREEYVIVDHGSERHGELEERGRPAAIISEPRREEIPVSREAPREEPIEEIEYNDEVEDDLPIYDEVDEDFDEPEEEDRDEDIEEITIDDLDDEEEEEEIPTLKTESKISSGDDDDDDSSDGVSISDWRK